MLLFGSFVCWFIAKSGDDTFLRASVVIILTLDAKTFWRQKFVHRTPWYRINRTTYTEAAQKTKIPRKIPYCYPQNSTIVVDYSILVPAVEFTYVEKTIPRNTLEQI
eukprot:scaffold148031_cov41-Attheya_sp.AAC.1